MNTAIAVWGRGILFALALGLAACNSDGSGSSDSGTPPVSGNPPNGNPTQPTNPEEPANVAPQIVGNPGNEVLVGSNYNFVPDASDSDGDQLTFSIDGQPSWASFNEATGRLHGTPDAGDVGSYEDIVISVSDGSATRTLPAFAINVVEQTSGSVTLAWEPPTSNTDGSTLTNLAGYRIHYGTESGEYDQMVDIDSAGITSYVIENLSPGTYYFAISAVATNGAEGEPSREASKEI